MADLNSVTPYKDMVLVRLPEGDTPLYRKGFILADVTGAQVRPAQGTVVEKGPLTKDVQIGDTAVFNHGAGESVFFGDEEYRFIPEELIIFYMDPV